MVRLGQLLKLAGIVDGGGEVKPFLADHEVL
jgi:ribosome-associated protein YbcJ (S4-like RNA binding protein)